MSDTGIGSMSQFKATTIIGLVKGDVVIDSQTHVPPLEYLRRHVCNAPNDIREEFVAMEAELEKTKPDKSLITKTLDKLQSTFGHIAGCVSAISKIADAVKAFSD